MKTCRTCLVPKKCTDYHRNRKSKDLHNSECKSCANERSRQWTKTEKGRLAPIKTRAKYRNARLAQKRFDYRIKTGDIIRCVLCEECGSDYRVQAHHDDYNKPLDVRWLCSQCHADWHSENKPLNREFGLFHTKKA